MPGGGTDGGITPGGGMDIGGGGRRVVPGAGGGGKRVVPRAGGGGIMTFGMGIGG